MADELNPESSTPEETPNVEEETPEVNDAGNEQPDSSTQEDAPDQAKIDAIGEGDKVSIEENEGAEGDPKTYTVKVDGEEIQVTHEELLRGYQLRKASDKRFEEAAELRKTAQKFLDLLKENPKKALRHPDLGIDVRTFAEELLNDFLEEEMLSPEEKRIKELERELEAKKEGENQKKAEAQKEEMEAEQARLAEEWGAELDETIKASGLPNNDNVYKRFLDYKQQSLERNLDMKFNEFVDWVKEDMQNEFATVLKGVTPEQIVKLFGEETLKQIRQFDVQRLKSPKDKTPEPEEQGQPRPKEGKKAAPKKTWKEYMDERRKAISGS